MREPKLMATSSAVVAEVRRSSMITLSFSGKDGHDTEVLEPEAIAVLLRENLIGIESDVVQGLQNWR